MGKSLPTSAAVALAAALTLSGGAPAQQFDEALFSSLQWDNVGISRGGRSIAVAGSASRPHVPSATSEMGVCSAEAACSSYVWIVL